MPIQERTNKKGEVTSYRVYWNNPVTKKKETQGGFKTRRDAEEFDSKQQHRIKFEPDTFKPVEKAKDAPEHVRYMDDLFLRYTNEKPLAESTRKNLPDQYLTWRDIMGNMLIEDIDHDAIRRFERGCRNITVRRGNKSGEKGLNQTTIHRRFDVIRAVLNWGVKERIIPGHNIHGYKMDKGQNFKEAPPTIEELKKMIAVAPKHLARAISLSLNLGCRVGESELLKLEWSHFNFDEGFVYVPEALKNKHKKLGTGRKVPLTDAFLATLKGWKAEDDLGKQKRDRKTGKYEHDGKPIPWPIHQNGKRVQGHFLRAWHTARKAAGIDRQITPYDLRHASATMLLEITDYNYKLVEKVTGTKAVTLMKNYQHVTEDQMRTALGQMPSL